MDRFSILRMLALHAPHPMDYWYLRAVSRGAPNRVHVDDAPAVASLGDSLLEVAPRLSIDSFWPMRERPTLVMSMWVEAFAQKRDPRLLPILLRHLQPKRLDPSVVDALAHYRGMPAAEEALIQVAAQDRIKAHKQAREVVRESLRQIGTPRARSVADQLEDASRGGSAGRWR